MDHTIDRRGGNIEWLTSGYTYLIPKSTDTNQSNKYRPITRLPTTYKLITGIIADATYGHLMRNELISKEQCGCRRNCYRVKEQLLINIIILENHKDYYI